MALIKATKRAVTGSRWASKLRKEGLIPGVVYGHGEETQHITLKEHDVELAVLHGERLLEIDCEGKTQNVLIKEVQYDTFAHQVLHIDLARVDLDESVEITVPITLKGIPVGVTDEDGVLQQSAPEVTIECPVRAIPEDITVVVTEMKVGDTLTTGDLPLPDGAKLLAAADVLVARVRVLVEEVAEEVAEEGGAQPEVIGETQEGEGEAASEK